MWEDHILVEVRKIREEHAAKFNHDLPAIYKDIKEQEKKSERTFISYPVPTKRQKSQKEFISNVPSEDRVSLSE